jgi:hypothetical protein
MNTLWIIGAGFLAVCAGVGLVALAGRRVGNTRQEGVTLLVVAAVLVIGSLGVVAFIDRIPMSANERWWVVRAGFVALSVVLWQICSRAVGKTTS